MKSKMELMKSFILHFGNWENSSRQKTRDCVSLVNLENKACHTSPGFPIKIFIGCKLFSTLYHERKRHQAAWSGVQSTGWVSDTEENGDWEQCCIGQPTPAVPALLLPAQRPSLVPGETNSHSYSPVIGRLSGAPLCHWSKLPISWAWVRGLGLRSGLGTRNNMPSFKFD